MHEPFVKADHGIRVYGFEPTGDDNNGPGICGETTFGY